MTIRLKILTNDRVGMVLDILKILYKYDVNLKALEVGPGLICLKMDKNFRVSLSYLLKQLRAQDDVIEISEAKLLPYEKREKHMKAVLDATGEGIIAIDKNGIITTFNAAAENILKVSAKVALGKNIADIISPDIPILKTIVTGESYDNEEMIINTPKLKSHYITSGRPILDEEGNPIGAVASLKDIENVMELIHTFTQPPMITFDEILGESKEITRVKELARIVAKGDSTVLIRGESGTGKELFARSIHMASSRRDKPFVAVNCAALPDTLLESELFGYEEGAFTGAKRGGKQGLFQYADKGTLFLDEIGELSPHLQVKLLRVLQENKIRRVGGDEEISVNVRIIAATNRNLEELMKNGQFRDDLYYRLNVIPLIIPPLRDRKEDIPILTRAFIKKLSYKMNKNVVDISDEAMRRLMNYDWPGNIRELSNVIERAMNLCDDVIQSHHLFLQYEELSSSVISGKLGQKTLKEIVEDAEKRTILDALDTYSSIRKAAKALGISHAALINKMKKYKINRGP
ncbi:sigma 54-interacting transcriptional regulator [Tepidanaerobacter sp. GT38]|uniref:sigma 54-interacting transcriptional regulator n=1 Tax=Tepidanaerobacter sp. GT38 TaxID=2722793 RepID=UPI001F005CBD|nr:sigma 54-interacting transcriptional regulator [Tepidanaerobacter sp. GT38]